MISFQDITYSYKKTMPLLEHMSFELEGGSIYGLLGKNGAGKTTVLKMICGLLLPDRGECRIMETSSEKRSADLLGDIFFIPEEFFTPPISVGQYIESYAPFYPRYNNNRMRELLQEIEITQDTKLENLSFGERKKFLIAFGIATETRVFIIDEPTNGLDIPGKSWFRKLLASSIDENKIYIISTHQARDMENLVDPIMILKKGEIVLNNSMTEINEKIAMYIEKDKPHDNEVIYSEKIPAGWMGVTENLAGDETSLDLEIFFNTVIVKTDEIKRIFSKGGVDEK